MQSAVNNVTDDNLPLGRLDATLQIQPDTIRHANHGRKIAGLRFSRMTIIGRLTVASFAMVIAGVALAVTVARTQAAPKTFDIPRELLQQNVPPSIATCQYLYYKYFNCTLNINGEAVSTEYDGAARTESYTSKSIQKLTLGDLIDAWGTPDGIAHYYQETIVIWGPRTAYFGVCAIKAASRVEYLGYGFSQQPTIPWRGFVSHISECADRQ